MPLLQLIKSVPHFSKFLKKLFTIKRKQKEKAKKKVKVEEQVSAVLTKKILKKCDDPEVFPIPCTIGKSLIPNALVDLGASFNVLPFELYEKLNLGTL